MYVCVCAKRRARRAGAAHTLPCALGVCRVSLPKAAYETLPSQPSSPTKRYSRA